MDVKMIGVVEPCPYCSSMRCTGESVDMEQRIAALTAERDQARAERDELDAAVTVSADSEDMLFTRVMQLEDRREDLEPLVCWHERRMMELSDALARENALVRQLHAGFPGVIESWREKVAQLEAENAALRAALVAQWSPVESCAYVDANGVMVYVERRYYMELVKDSHELVAILDDDHAFCERRASAQEQATTGGTYE